MRGRTPAFYLFRLWCYLRVSGACPLPGRGPKPARPGSQPASQLSRQTAHRRASIAAHPPSSCTSVHQPATLAARH